MYVVDSAAVVSATGKTGDGPSCLIKENAVAVLAFVFAPKTPAVLLVFAAVIGLTYLSTVPPTVAPS